MLLPELAGIADRQGDVGGRSDDGKALLDQGTNDAGGAVAKAAVPGGGGGFHPLLVVNN